MTDDMNDEPWACRVAGRAVNVPSLQHYRLVMDTVGRPLGSVRGAQELLHAAYDVFTGTHNFVTLLLLLNTSIAMRDAIAKDNRIHRDLSVGNVILVKENSSNIRRGYLIDWEASCEIDVSGEAKEQGLVVSSYWRVGMLSTQEAPPVGYMAVCVNPHA